MEARKAKISRNTKETSITVALNVDGTGKSEITTGLLFFDHMLNQLSQHGLFDLNISASGPDEHHVVEDVAICLGKAFNQALGDRKGIVRMAHAMVPMDESLAIVAIDISGRGYSVIEVNFNDVVISKLPSDLINHFLVSLAAEARINLHVRIASGSNDHHKAEAIFKGLARALDSATKIDPRIAGLYPSTKDYIEA
jgi:imidazoleglycerol-phosphate dehydratase